MRAASDWLEDFARRDEAGRAWIAGEHRRIGALIAGETGGLAPREVSSAATVLEPGSDVEVDEPTLVATARRMASLALSLGWSVRIVRSVAAVPKLGLVLVVTLRMKRHDERCWAAWWNGRFECAQYWSSEQAIESLAASSVAQRAKTEATVAAKAGRAPRPVLVRGLVDAIEGRRLPS